jgi:ribosomal protein S18 acetylase RimI-like enzyme
MDSPACCRYLPWDSAHFGMRIGRVNATRLTPGVLADIDRWSRLQSIDCLYFLSDPDPAAMRLAAEAGFRYVDARTTLAAELTKPAEAPAIRPATLDDGAGAVLSRAHSGEALAIRPATLDDGAGAVLSHAHSGEAPAIRPATLDDLPELRRIAGESHRDTRFYADGRFPTGACDELYRIWIGRSCSEPEFADAVFVAEQEHHAAGYVSCRLADGAGEIGLLAVDGKYRGLGLGEQLVRRAGSWFRERGAPRASVVTQGANVRALRLYQKCGFFVAAVQFWYHRWSSRE